MFHCIFHYMNMTEVLEFGAGIINCNVLYNFSRTGWLLHVDVPSLHFKENYCLKMVELHWNKTISPSAR